VSRGSGTRDPHASLLTTVRDQLFLTGSREAATGCNGHLDRRASAAVESLEARREASAGSWGRGKKGPNSRIAGVGESMAFDRMASEHVNALMTHSRRVE